jgi:hypothetical protein
MDTPVSAVMPAAQQSKIRCRVNPRPDTLPGNSGIELFESLEVDAVLYGVFDDSVMAFQGMPGVTFSLVIPVGGGEVAPPGGRRLAAPLVLIEIMLVRVTCTWPMLAIVKTVSPLNAGYVGFNLA